MSDRRPCPFCGAREQELVLLDVKQRQGFPVALVCIECGAHGPWTYSADEAMSVALAEQQWQRTPELDNEQET